jgi:hypothetical protein
MRMSRLMETAIFIHTCVTGMKNASVGTAVLQFLWHMTAVM